MITGDQAIAVLGLMGQQLINSTQLVQRNQLATSTIEQLQAERDEARSRLDELERELAEKTAPTDEEPDDQSDSPASG